jgi:predicted TIM-barrel fold metal-dependent hydrolase
MNGQSSSIVPKGTWDTHLHVLDPETFPYKADRTYTPAAAGLEDLMTSTLADCFLIVQASVENGMEATLQHLQKASKRYPDKVFRAEIEIPKGATFMDEEFKHMSDLGVRAVRLHGEIGMSGDILDGVKGEFRRLASYTRAAGWYISAMCPLNIWNDIGEWLVTSPEMQDVRIIVEHNGRIDPARDVANYPELDTLLDLLSRHQSKFAVKICGINRLESSSDTPGRIAKIPAAVLAITQGVPDLVVWGSDWPHTDYKIHGTQFAPNKVVDLSNEVRLLTEALTPELCSKLFRDNAARLFT